MKDNYGEVKWRVLTGVEPSYYASPALSLLVYRYGNTQILHYGLDSTGFGVVTLTSTYLNDSPIMQNRLVNYKIYQGFPHVHTATG